MSERQPWNPMLEEHRHGSSIGFTLLQASQLVKHLEEEVGRQRGGSRRRWPPPRRRRRRRRRGREDRLLRHPRDRGRQEDPGHQGSPRDHGPRPQGSQGPRRRRPEGRQGRGLQGRGRGHQEARSKPPAARSRSTEGRPCLPCPPRKGPRPRRLLARASGCSAPARRRFCPRAFPQPVEGVWRTALRACSRPDGLPPLPRPAARPADPLRRPAVPGATVRAAALPAFCASSARPEQPVIAKATSHATDDRDA